MTDYLALSQKIKNRMSWDKIFLIPAPRSKVLHEGYRINISGEDESDIEKAKAILTEADVIFDDRHATSFSESVEPGDRTLRVIHQKSVVNLRKMWADEFEKMKLARSLKEQKERK